MKEKYIHYKKAGDQYVGRVATGLNVNSVEFVVLPPYFKFPSVDEGEGNSPIEDKIKQAITSLVPGGRHMSAQTFQLLTFCYASIAYHYDHLDRVLHSRSRVQQSPLFQRCKDEWKAITTISFPWSTTPNCPHLTGIPPHVVLLSKLHGISSNIENFIKNDFKDILVKELDEREIGSNNFAA